MEIVKGASYQYADSFYSFTIETVGKKTVGYLDGEGYWVDANKADFLDNLKSGYLRRV